MRNTNGTIVFPAMILAHEGGHALQDEKYNNKEWKILVNTFDAEYDDSLEEEVITNIEQYVAKRHGDIKEGQTTQKDHKGICPNSCLKKLIWDVILFLKNTEKKY